MGIRDRMHAMRDRFKPQDRKVAEAVVALGELMLQMNEKLEMAKAESREHDRKQDEKIAKIDSVEADTKAMLGYLRTISGKRVEEQHIRYAAARQKADSLRAHGSKRRK